MNNSDALSNILQTKIIELSPKKPEVDGESVDWVPEGNPDEGAAWVPASVQDGDGRRTTVRVAMPVAGKGLEQSGNGILNVKVDPGTMEILGDGTIMAKTPSSAGVIFVPKSVRLDDGFTMFEFADGDGECSRKDMLVSPDKYPVNTGNSLEPGKMVVPGNARWVNVDAILTFTVKRYSHSVWEYNCSFVVRTYLPDGTPDTRYAFPFVLDTTTHLSVFHCPVSFYCSGGVPFVIDTGVEWERDADDSDREVTCDARVTVRTT